MKRYYIIFSVFYLFVFLAPIAVNAQVSLPYFGGNPPFVSCGVANCTTCDLFETGQRVIYFGMTMVLFVLAPIMITWGGIMMLIAGGNEDRFTTGKKMATGAVVGILIALGAFLIVNLTVTTLANGRIEGMTLSGLTISCTATSPYVPPTPSTGSGAGTECPTGSNWIAADNQCEYGDGSTAAPVPANVPPASIPTGGPNDIAPI